MENINLCYLHEYFFVNCHRHLEKKAITYVTDSECVHQITYEELLHECRQITRIIENYLKPKIKNGFVCVVGICCDNGPGAISCILGILNSCAFTYVSPTMVDPEIADLIFNIPITMLFIEKTYLYKLLNLPGIKFCEVEEFNIFKVPFVLVNFQYEMKDSHTKKVLNLLKYPLAYAICTSGSTGKPKIIYVPHKCIVPNIKDFIKIFNICDRDILLSLTPLYFDPCMIDIFCALSCGANIVLFSSKTYRKPAVLEKILRSQDISIIQTTPMFLNMLNTRFLRDYVHNSINLRVVAFGGENFPSTHKFYQIFNKPGIKFFNLYGLTEMSCWSTCEEVHIKDYISDSSLKNNHISIGNALSESEVYLVDDSGNKLHSGSGTIMIIGERNICVIYEQINGEYKCGVAINTGDKGYIKDGKMFFEGRVDDIVKRNACKISLSEIEYITKASNNVEDCAAVFVDNKIILFVCSSNTLAIDYGDIELYLSKNLSFWKLPDKIKLIEKIPINKNGKIDKRHLIDLCCISNEVKGENKNLDINLTLKTFWKEILKCSGFTEEDNFLNLGGNSITAVQLSERIYQTFEIEQSVTFDTILNGTFHDICTLLNENFHIDIKPKSNKKTKLDNAVTIENVNTEISKEITDCVIVSRRSFNSEIRNTNSHVSSFKDLDIKWKQSLSKCIDASPVLCCKDNETLIFIGSHSHIFLCMNEEGQIIWSITLPDRIEASATLSLDGEHVYVGCYDGYLYALNTSDGLILWKFYTEGIIKCSPDIHDPTSYLVFGSYDKFVYCCNKSGEEIWKKKISDGSIYSSSLIKGDYVYAATLDGYLVCLNIFSGCCRWEKRFEIPIFSSLSDTSIGIVFGCVNGMVYCIDYNSNILWQYQSDGSIFSSPFVFVKDSLKVIAIGSNDKYLHLLDLLGNLIHRISLTSSVVSTPFITGIEEKNAIYVMTAETKGIIYIHKVNCTTKSSTMMCKYQLDGEVFSSPIFYNGCLYVGCRNDYLYSFNCF